MFLFWNVVLYKIKEFKENSFLIYHVKHLVEYISVSKYSFSSNFLKRLKCFKMGVKRFKMVLKRFRMGLKGVEIV